MSKYIKDKFIKDKLYKEDDFDPTIEQLEERLAKYKKPMTTEEISEEGL
jgi:hypothetical protein